MHPSLAPHLHSEDCRKVIALLHQCHKEHKFSKFLGRCNELKRELNACLQREYVETRKQNFDAAQERKKAWREKFGDKNDLRILNRVGSDGDISMTEDLDMGPLQLSKLLQKQMLQMKGEFMGCDGRGVDYGRLAASATFQQYTSLAERLRTCAVANLSEPQRMAFFINVYNALTIHGLVSLPRLPASVLEVTHFWKTTSYVISGMVFSLDDIEHGVLRGNKPHPNSTQPPFGNTDPRRLLSLRSCDPRLHFALVCGAKSCPAIQVYSEENMEQALTMAAQNFCAQEVMISPADMKVSVNKIMQWYGCDFGSSHEQILKCVCGYLPEDSRTTLLAMMERGTVAMETREYNWTLNKL